MGTQINGPTPHSLYTDQSGKGNKNLNIDISKLIRSRGESNQDEPTMQSLSQHRGDITVNPSDRSNLISRQMGEPYFSHNVQYRDAATSEMQSKLATSDHHHE